MAVTDNKNLWIIGLIVVIVGIFAFTNLNAVTGQAQNALPTNVKANSCDRDNDCEIINALVSGDVFTSSIIAGGPGPGNDSGADSLSIEATNIDVLLNTGAALSVTGVVEATSEVRSDIRVWAGDGWVGNHGGGEFALVADGDLLEFYAGGSSGTEDMSLKSDGTLTTKSLTGTGNAFVCVNSLGTLYRSNVACV
mgnify:CR=1 FL=1